MIDYIMYLVLFSNDEKFSNYLLKKQNPCLKFSKSFCILSRMKYSDKVATKSSTIIRTIRDILP